MGPIKELDVVGEIDAYERIIGNLSNKIKCLSTTGTENLNSNLKIGREAGREAASWT
jgi:hypothetical protein